MKITFHKSYALITHLFMVHLAFICFFSLIFGFILDKKIAYSFLCGSLIFWFSSFYSLRIVKIAPTLLWFYCGLVIKWLLVLIMLSAIFLKVNGINHVFLLIGFISSIFLGGFIPLLLSFKFITAR